jgi:hypothetical protein
MTSTGRELRRTGSTASESGHGVRTGRIGWRTISGSQISLAVHLLRIAASGSMTPVVWTTLNCKTYRAPVSSATFARYEFLHFWLRTDVNFFEHKGHVSECVSTCPAVICKKDVRYIDKITYCNFLIFNVVDCGCYKRAELLIHEWEAEQPK